MPKHPKTSELREFKGLNNVLPPERTDPQYLKLAENIDIDKSGGIQKREGYSVISSGSYHSLWADGDDCFVVKDGDLVRIRSDYSMETLLSDVGDIRLSFEKVDGTIYYTSKSFTGIIDANGLRNFGIPNPNPRPIISTTTGILDKGTYQVSLTYVADDGRESGAGLAQVVDVPQNGGILLSNIPASTDSTVEKIRVYCSTPNGEILYLVEELPHPTSSFTIFDMYGAITPLKSFNVYTAPNGHIIRYAHGRLLVAQDDVLWYSEPFAYEWWKPHSNFYVFEERITAIMPTEGGVWVAADKLYYLIGRDLNSVKRKEVEPVKAIEGSDVKIVGSYVFIENTPIGYKWLVTTDKGIYVCFNDGIALNMTEKNVVFPEAVNGTATFVQKDGINKYVSLLQKKRDSDNTAVGDLVTATIIRNGVTIN